MKTDMSQFYEAFFEDARQHLSETEHMLLAINLPVLEKETMNALFRAIHSIKGSAATFGFNQVTALTHEYENILDRIRHETNRGIELTKEKIDTLLAVNDEIVQQLESYRLGTEPDLACTQAAIFRLQTAFDRRAQVTSITSALKYATSTEPVNHHHLHYQIELLHVNEKDAQSLTQELTLLGKVSQRMPLDGNAIIDLYTAETITTVQSICTFVVDLSDIAISSNSTHHHRQQVLPRLQEEKRKTSPLTSASATSIRVNIEKIDTLSHLISELASTQRMLEQSGRKHRDDEQQKISDGMQQLSKHVRDLQAIILSIRMISIQNLFSRFPRMIRELATQLNKKAELSTTGSPIDIDPHLIEALGDPITHLLRNCMDHGIEMPEQRILLGKNETGQLELSASHKGDHIEILISDDGAGLNRDRIIEVAREKGLISTEDLSDAQAWNLIFEPGFSTTYAVTETSGRGVGMDIVKENVSALGGTILIQSYPGLGTTFVISIPAIHDILSKQSAQHSDEINLNQSVGILPVALQFEEKHL